MKENTKANIWLLGILCMMGLSFYGTWHGAVVIEDGFIFVISLGFAFAGLIAVIVISAWKVDIERAEDKK